MSPGQIMNKTAPFLILKAILSALPMLVMGGAFLWLLIIVVDVVRPFIPDDLSAATWYTIYESVYQGSPYITVTSRDFIAPLRILIIFPIVYGIIGRVPRYLVRVGHIAVLTHVILTGKVPEKQLSFGFGQVKQNFGRAAAFFFLDRLIYQAVSQLSMQLRRMLGFGPAVFFINRFKAKFIKYVDECILAYTFARPDTGPFESSLHGFVVYMKNWAPMAKSAVWTALLVWFISFIFYVVTFALMLWGFAIGQFVIVIVGYLIYVFFGTLKKCFLDSLAMVRMMTVFLRSANRNQELAIGDLMQYSSFSPGFRQLVVTADQHENIFSSEDKEKLFSARPRNFF